MPAATSASWSNAMRTTPRWPDSYTYLTIYNREPTAAERDRATQHLGSRRAHRRKAAEDLAWAMLNSMEFIFNH